MPGKLRVAWILLTACSLLSFLTLRGLVFAAPEQQTPLAGHAEINGPLHLAVDVSPPVTHPRESIEIVLTLTNNLPAAASPQVIVQPPDALSLQGERFPSGTTLDYQSNTLNWQPVVAGNGGIERITLVYDVSVANLAQPEEQIAVRLRNGDSENETSVAVWIGLPPTAALTVEPVVAAVGQEITLTAQPGGPGPFSQTWELGDGRTVTAKNPKVSFAVPGVYEIKLQVANPLAVATALGSVTIVSQPSSEFSVSDDRPVVGEAVHFFNESGGEGQLAFQWDFGDGATSRDVNPDHVYIAPGTYMVALSVQSDYGRAETTFPITVGAAPVVDAVIPEEAATGQLIEARAFGDDTVSNFHWEMGDGTSHDGELISHAYHRLGDFQVTLTAENEFGSTQITRMVHVERGIFSQFLPFLSRAGALDDAANAASAPPAPGPPAAVEPAAPETAPGATDSGLLEEPLPAEPPVSPGGASAGPPDAQSALVKLPPQTPLADDATPAERLLWYINEARRLHGLPAVTYNYELSVAAQQHTVDMSLNEGVMHEGSDGSLPAERQKRYGYPGAYGGEAVAWGWENPIPVVEFWVNSPPHRALILNPAAVEVGIGHMADGRAANIWYWAIEFGLRDQLPIRTEEAPQPAPEQ